MNETTSARAERSSGPPAPTQGTRLGWVDGIKGIALIWIFLNHAVERVLGCAHFCNPVPGWPPLAERLRQLVPLEGYGGWGIALNLVRYIGWTGDQGVQLFLIASGFGLTWGLLERGTGPILSRMPFLMKRGMRLYPMWWGVHGVVLLFWILGGTTLGRSFFLSLLGIRFTRSTYYSFSPSWWFVGLLIQLYALYPTLWNLQARWGSGRLLFRSLVVCLAARAVGIYVLKDTLDLWLRGAVFITRLPEFVLGMLLASVLHRAPELTDRRLRSLGGILASLAVYAVGTAL
jgi:peptidoglycan/LPS O-acetylase OafA/YrhL